MNVLHYRALNVVMWLKIEINNRIMFDFYPRLAACVCITLLFFC